LEVFSVSCTLRLFVRLIKPRKSQYCLYFSSTSGFTSGNFDFFLSIRLRTRALGFLTTWVVAVGSSENFLTNCGGGEASLTFSLRLGVSSLLTLIGGNLVTVLVPCSLSDSRFCLVEWLLFCWLPGGRGDCCRTLSLAPLDCS
jgi:hypothetical protein